MAKFEMAPTDAFVGGRWVQGERRFEVMNPATREVVASVTDCGIREAELAIAASEAAFQTWSRTTAYERSRILQSFHALMVKNTEHLATTMASEMGKPIREARGEVAYAAGFVAWYAEEAKRLYGDTIPTAFAHKRIIVQIGPVGVVYAVTPWNFPAAMVTRKLAPALAAGCTMMLKPSKLAPLTSLKLAELLQEAGLPEGVLQVLPSSHPGPLSERILKDARVSKLTFTGSSATGTLLYTLAAATVKRVSLELGGNAPLIVFDDADLDRAVEETVKCKFRNAGQTCVCANRIFVQRGIAERYTERLAGAVAALKVGLPLQEETDIGPLVDEQGYRKVVAHVTDAIAHGATVVVGGKPINRTDLKGYFYEPTVLTGVRPSMCLSNEETFGPIAPLSVFATEEEAITQANATPYGLASYLFTTNLSRAMRVSERLEAGIVGINDGLPSTPQAPFGGVKLSGIGREGGKYGIEEYIERKYVSIAI
jgi:succinate-semialdehyde dehydrogenase/glutarate-semialdehyde dehydrogenase